MRTKIKEKSSTYFNNLFHNLEPETLDMVENKGYGEDVISSTRFLFRYMEEIVSVTSSIAERDGRIDTLTQDNIAFFEGYVSSEITRLVPTLTELAKGKPGKCSEKLSLLVEEYMDFEESGREDVGGLEATFEEFVAEAEAAGRIGTKQKEGLMHIKATMQPLMDHYVEKELVYPLMAAPVLLSYIIMLPVENAEELINIITAALSTYVGYLL